MSTYYVRFDHDMKCECIELISSTFIKGNVFRVTWTWIFGLTCQI